MFEKIAEFLQAYRNAGYPCLFHAATGLYCPGCGGTRAVVALLHGQILRSALYHPLVLYCATLVIYLLVRHVMFSVKQKKEKTASSSPIHHPSYLKEWMLWLMLVIVILNFLVKNIALVLFHVDLLA